jgi:hypothetical protein
MCTRRIPLVANRFDFKTADLTGGLNEFSFVPRTSAQMVDLDNPSKRPGGLGIRPHSEVNSSVTARCKLAEDLHWDIEVCLGH